MKNLTKLSSTSKSFQLHNLKKVQKQNIRQFSAKINHAVAEATTTRFQFVSIEVHLHKS